MTEIKMLLMSKFDEVWNKMLEGNQVIQVI